MIEIKSIDEWITMVSPVPDYAIIENPIELIWNLKPSFELWRLD